jgi:ATP-dependent RNA helicase DDX31/DBP7
MIGAGVPYPLCRFVVDLLGGECSDGLLFRSDSSFESFSDILQDLEQMIANPEAFIHLSIKDQWRLAFGEKMHGRDKEQKMLLDAAARVTGTRSNDALLEALAMLTPQGKQQIVMVTGSAGIGKSRLVMETKKNLENRGWVFLHCKFDRIVHSEPLSIIAGAFDEFLEQCIGTLRQHQIQKKLKAMMHPTDLSILIKHVPCLAKFLDDPPENIGCFEANKDQVHHLFCKLIAALSAPGQAAALFCDDLQWADTASLDLFAALTKASEPDLSSSNSSGIPKKPKLLFIGAYRDNEVNDNARLVELLNSLKSTSTVQVTEINVRGFDFDAMNMIVSESLCLPLRRTKPLTEIILQKTDGIVIHIIEFIGRLTAERILCHSFVKGWEWDSETIESCPISDSVAELFTHKLKRLSAADVLGLQICSIFGIRIEQQTINLLRGYDGDDSVDIGAALKAAIEVGLVEVHGSLKMFRFAHDIIAQVRSFSVKFLSFLLRITRLTHHHLSHTDCFRFDSQRRTEAATEEARIRSDPECNRSRRD